MRTAELCCPLDEDHVLIPQLLSSVEPAFDFDHEGSLRFVLDYDDFLPQSIMSRFIIKRHRDLKNGLCWRGGIGWISSANNRVCVQELPGHTYPLSATR